MNCDRLHGRIAWKTITLSQPYPYTPAIRIDTRIILLLTSNLHYICDVMLGGGLAMALYADNVVITWGDLGVRLGCVVRVESTR